MVELPVYWGEVMLCQILVGLGEWSATEESSVGRQRRGVCGGEDTMTGAVDECPLALGVRSPKDEHDILSMLGNGSDDCVGKLLPALPLM